MTPSTELFQLIKSLSASEKRFFKLFASLNTGDKNYIKLFTAIDRQKVYDEERIKQDLKKENFIRHLPAEKNRLQKQILRTLRVVHAESDAENTIHSRLTEINILNEKKLYSISRDMIRKTKGIAQQHHKHEYEFALIRMDAEIDDRSSDIKETKKNIEKHFQELNRIIGYLAGYNKIKKLYDTFWLYARERNKDMKQLHALGRSVDLKQFKTGDGFYAEKLFYAMNATYKLFAEKLDESIIFLEKHVALMEKFPEHLRDYPKGYQAALNNLLTRYIYTGAEKKFFETLAKYRLLPDLIIPFRRESYRAKIALLAIQLEVGFYTDNRFYKKALLRLPALLNEADEFTEHMMPEYRIILKFTTAKIYFLNARFKECLKEISELKEKSLIEFRKDLQHCSALMRLCCYFELKDIVGMELALNDFKSLIKNEKLDYKCYRVLVSFFTKALNTKPSFPKLEKILSPLLKDQEEQSVLRVFDFMEWIKGKLK